MFIMGREYPCATATPIVLYNPPRFFKKSKKNLIIMIIIIYKSEKVCYNEYNKMKGREQ